MHSVAEFLAIFAKSAQVGHVDVAVVREHKVLHSGRTFRLKVVPEAALLQQQVSASYCSWQEVLDLMPGHPALPLRPTLPRSASDLLSAVLRGLEPCCNHWASKLRLYVAGMARAHRTDFWQ